MTQYVVGFQFTKKGSFVVLQEKNRPAWQRGRLNGPGGHVEENETPVQTMCREWLEECGTTTLGRDWLNFAVVSGPDWAVYFFSNFDDAIHRGTHSASDEPVFTYEVSEVLAGEYDVIPNVRYLIPLALYWSADLSGTRVQLPVHFREA